MKKGQRLYRVVNGELETLVFLNTVKDLLCPGPWWKIQSGDDRLSIPADSAFLDKRAAWIHYGKQCQAKVYQALKSLGSRRRQPHP